VPSRASDLPDALVRLAPSGLEELEQVPLRAEAKSLLSMPTRRAWCSVSITFSDISWSWLNAALPIRRVPTLRNLEPSKLISVAPAGGPGDDLEPAGPPPPREAANPARRTLPAGRRHEGKKCEGGIAASGGDSPNSAPHPAPRAAVVGPPRSLPSARMGPSA
jgi:hypothetical protein